MEIYAYGRVSARDQNLERQIAAFLNFGVKPKNIYCDKKSGKNFERQHYLRLMKKLQPGDLVITLGCGDIYKAAKLMIKKFLKEENYIET